MKTRCSLCQVWLKNKSLAATWNLEVLCCCSLLRFIPNHEGTFAEFLMYFSDACSILITRETLRTTFIELAAQAGQGECSDILHSLTIHVVVLYIYFECKEYLPAKARILHQRKQRRRLTCITPPPPPIPQERGPRFEL